jgi:hypothetical protein
VRYEEINPTTRAAAIAALRGDDSDVRSVALLSLALHDPDRQWVEAVCVAHADDADPAVRGAALLGFAHLARIHGALDLHLAAPSIRRGLEDPILEGRAADVVDDLEVVLGVDAVREAGLASRRTG